MFLSDMGKIHKNGFSSINYPIQSILEYNFQRGIKNNSKNKKVALHFQVCILDMNLSSKHHFWLNITKRNFRMQMERYQKCMVASVMFESLETYAAITVAIAWIF